MAISDAAYKLGVAAGGAALVAMIGYLRFCGSVTIAPKPPPPAGPTGTARELVSKANAQAPVYEEALREDAHNAGVATPSVAQMGAKLAYRADDATHVLVAGQPLDLAGLRLTLQRTGDTLQLQISDQLNIAVAYRVDTEVSLGSLCMSTEPLPFDAMVLHPGMTETRTECVYRPDVTTKVTHVETVELPAMSAYYIDLVQPRMLNIEERIARGHHVAGATCSSALPQQIRSGIENGEIKWRDLIDFYARQNCDRYVFPLSYHAFTRDREMNLPVVETRM